MVLVGILVGLGAFYAYQVTSAFGAVAVEDFNPEGARLAISAAPDVVGPTTTWPSFDADSYDVDAEVALIAAQMAKARQRGNFNRAAFGEPIPDELFEAYLLVGTDASGFLADTIILALQPDDGTPPIMVSLPRDLFVWNLCEDGFTRLNSGLGGCEGASGFELLAIMVEDYTGIPIDHLARVNFAGFARMVDVMGGVTVCVDRPTRDLKSHLSLDKAGCRRANGEVALAWVRSRHPEELIGGEWRPVSGSDFTRQAHQQDVLFQLAGKAATFSSPATLVDRLSAVSSSVKVDSSWSFVDAVVSAWRYRGITRDEVLRFSIEATDYRTSYGAQVLLPAVPFREQLATVYDLG